MHPNLIAEPFLDARKNRLSARDRPHDSLPEGVSLGAGDAVGRCAHSGRLSEAAAITIWRR